MHEAPELRPLAFGPNLPERFYRGGAGIARFRGIEQAAPNIPKDFIASTTEVFGGGGIGLSALDDGTVLRDAVAANPVGFLGRAHAARFGADPAVLVKMLDTTERLVVHFHPDGSFARRHLGCSHGKNEAWLITEVILDPADDSSGHVFLGFTEDVTDGVVRDWMRRQDKAELLGSLNKVPARPGSTFFVPAGVPHAIGAGITMVEVQEPVDLSILLEWEGFDIDGPNEGHLGLGFDTALTGLTRTAWDSADVAAMSGHSAAPGCRRLPVSAAQSRPCSSRCSEPKPQTPFSRIWTACCSPAVTGFAAAPVPAPGYRCWSPSGGAPRPCARSSRPGRWPPTPHPRRAS